MEWWLTALAVIWVASGVATYGMSLAYFQKAYPLIAKESARSDVVFCATMSIFGCCALLGYMVFRSGNSPRFRGFMWWPPK